ncbi:Hypothetical predicted protein, partial [Pelobates cultripes]
MSDVRGTRVPRGRGDSAFTAAPFRVVTQNCRGLNAPEKRAHLLRELKQQHVSVALLQETHLRVTDTRRLTDRRFPDAFHSTHPTARKAGVAILLANSLHFTQSDMMADGYGKYLFVKGVVAQRTYTFASIYAPNTKQAKFLRATLLKLANFTEGALIMGGDFNAPLDPILDSSTGHSSIPQTAIRTIRRTLRNLRLVDAWRTLHPGDRDYTHYSALHHRHSRIDYLFLQQEGLHGLLDVEIRPTPWSDHSAVSMLMDSPLYRPVQSTWRLNESLLSDIAIQAQLVEHLNNYFTENDTDDVSALTLWEAHKSVLRGLLIRISAEKKREAQQQMASLADQIATLETLHKRTQLESHYRTLLTTRRQLTELIARKHYRTTQRSKAFFYIHANKGGRLLAHMIRNQQATAQ